MIQSSKWTRALVESLAALLLFLVIVGMFFLPNEFQQRQKPTRKHVVDCCLSKDAMTVVALVATSHQHQRSNRIFEVAMNFDQPMVRDITPELTPRCMTLEPTGARMYVGDVRGSIYEVQFDSGTVKSYFAGHVFRDFPLTLAITLDASKLVIKDDFGLYAWKLDRQAEVIHSPLWNTLDRSITCFALTPDSQTGFCGRSQHNGSQVLEFEMGSGNITPIFENLSGTLKRIVISRNGLFILTVTDSGEIMIWKRDTSQEPWEEYSINGLGTGVSYVASFSPHSNVLITSDREGHRLKAWSLSRRELLYEFAPTDNYLLGCEFLDEEQVLSWGMDDRLRFWRLNTPAPIREIRL